MLADSMNDIINLLGSLVSEIFGGGQKFKMEQQIISICLPVPGISVVATLVKILMF